MGPHIHSVHPFRCPYTHIDAYPVTKCFPGDQDVIGNKVIRYIIVERNFETCSEKQRFSHLYVKFFKYAINSVETRMLMP